MNKSIAISILLATLLTGCITTQEVVVGKDSEGNEIVREVGSFDKEKAAISRINLANVLISQKDMTQAKNNLEIAESYNPGTIPLYLTWGYYYTTVRANEKARQVYEEAFHKYPDSGIVATHYATFLCSQGEYQRADTLFNQAVNIPKYSDISFTYSEAAKCADKSGNAAKTKEYYELAMNYGGSSAGLLYDYAKWSYKHNDLVKAQNLIETFDMFQKDATPQGLYLHYQIARAQGNLEEASNYGEKLVKRFSKSKEAKQYLSESN